MPVKTHTVEVEDDFGNSQTYQITSFGTSKGLEIKRDLVRILGPSIGHSVEGLGEAAAILQEDGVKADIGKVLAGVDGDLLARAIEGATDRIGVGGMANLCKRILENAKRQNPSAPDGWFSVGQYFEVAYAENYGELYAVIRKVLEVNYGRFFEKVIGGALETVGLTRVSEESPSSQQTQE